MAITAWGLQTGWIAVGLISLVLMAPLGTALIEPRRRTIARQCLSRRIGSQEELEREVQAWQQSRNAEAITVNWRFTTADARIKLKRLYPSLEKKSKALEDSNVAKND